MLWVLEYPYLPPQPFVPVQVSQEELELSPCSCPLVVLGWQQQQVWQWQVVREEWQV